MLSTAASAASKAKVPATQELWEMSLDGGRRLTWERSFTSESEIKPNRGFWNKLVDVVAGAPDFRFLVRPYSVIADSRGRIIVTDPGASGVHIFDFAQRKYKFIERKEKSKDAMKTPQCVAVDAQDNIYVTDSEAGKIFVFEPSGKYMVCVAFSLLFAMRVMAAVHPVPLDKNTDAKKCLECHDDKAKHKFVHSAMQGGCLGCHEIRVNKDVTRVKLITATPAALCISCHEAREYGLHTRKDEC